ncbi:camphor resistance protein CrcB [Thiogranum longum]|uniref:Fluoride-specific ion channel FluC n=1 Tax=Thiogranum longum TaxID=1537524 RepID=A0A4R1H8X6_9GAMM|nr:fluoride efflux transporter CrcB [Thiogranum longum]TCK18297.1 camphor resistance protein CrcB [Thiogranum longum]
MSQVLAIAGGGALGAVLRYWVSTGVYAMAGRGFPYGTLAVNILGSLLMGFLYIWLLERSLESAGMRAFLLIGLLGAFTTFSTFSIETLILMEGGQYVRALVNTLASVVLCVAAAALGVMLARQL